MHCDRPYERLDISGVKGLKDAQRASPRALGAIEDGRRTLNTLLKNSSDSW
jgi:hypothetical protein